MCSKWFGRKDVLRQHLVLHYKKQLGKQFVSKENNPEKNICGLCQFQAKDPKALIQHIALGTHLKKKNWVVLHFQIFLRFPQFFARNFYFKFFVFLRDSAIPRFSHFYFEYFTCYQIFRVFRNFSFANTYTYYSFSVFFSRFSNFRVFHIFRVFHVFCVFRNFPRVFTVL